MVGAWTNPIIHHSMRKNSSKGQGKIDAAQAKHCSYVIRVILRASMSSWRAFKAKILSRGDVGAMMAVTVVSSCDEVLTPAIMQAERRPYSVKNHCKSGSAQFRP